MEHIFLTPWSSSVRCSLVLRQKKRILTKKDKEKTETTPVRPTFVVRTRSKWYINISAEIDFNQIQFNLIFYSVFYRSFFRKTKQTPNQTTVPDVCELDPLNSRWWYYLPLILMHEYCTGLTRHYCV